jgi:hypothetical protein
MYPILITTMIGAGVWDEASPIWKQPTSIAFSESAAAVTNIRTVWGGTSLDKTIDILDDTVSPPVKVAHTVVTKNRTKVMERILNDYRMSFFGTSPAYQATFRPLDFDGDGEVHASCYEINTDPTKDGLTGAQNATYKTARWQKVDEEHPKSGRGPAPTALTPMSADEKLAFSSNKDPDFDGSNPWFCATGSFFIGKSHYYRIWVRGEVYDNLLKKPLLSRTLEHVLAVDPESTIDPEGNVGYAGRPADNIPFIQTLFQRWHLNDVQSELPRHVR